MTMATWQAVVMMTAVLTWPPAATAQAARPALLDLWASGKTAFGVFVPDENTAPRGAQTRAPG
jgi:hypothetical protein